MESSSSKKNKQEKNVKAESKTDTKKEAKEETKAKLEKNNESNKMKEISQVDKRINECIVQKKMQPFEQLDRQIMNVSKSVCKLKIETLSETIIGTGFLLKFRINQEPFYCLMSNEHIMIFIYIMIMNIK